MSLMQVFMQRIIRAKLHKYSFDELLFGLEINSLLEDPGYTQVVDSLYDS